MALPIVDQAAESLATAGVLAVAVQLGDVARLFAVLTAVLSELTTFGNQTNARRMGALIGIHDFSSQLLSTTSSGALTRERLECARAAPYAQTQPSESLRPIHADAVEPDWAPPIPYRGVSVA